MAMRSMLGIRPDRIELAYGPWTTVHGRGRFESFVSCIGPAQFVVAHVQVPARRL